MHSTHQPRTLFDPQVGTLEFFWDANGNLAQMIGCKQNSGRLHEWDVKRNSRTEKSPVDSSRSKCGARVCQSKHRTQLDRLRFVLGGKYAGYYGYNADGERVYKLTGMSVMDQVNSGSTKAQAIFDEAILYPNPYMVVTRKGYTKHYYAGTERLATVIGGGGLNELTQAIVPAVDPHDDEIKKAFDKPYLNYDPFRHQGTVGSLVPTEDISGKTSPELEYQCKPAELLMVEVLGDKDMLLAPIKEYSEVREEETKRYFYHSDHLGSANWITESSGIPVQYIHYAPYGELIADQQVVGYDERYKFTGRERDRETGYDMFGARYLWSDAGIWTSVDPLADKYPYISPYAYCGWNPIKYVDPNGREWKDCDGNIIKDHSNIKAYIFYNKEEFGTQTTKMYSDLENKYGKGSVALSDVLTAKEFQQDWVAMSSQDIQEVSINHHGSNQAIHLDWRNNEYITSTGTGETRGGVPAINVSDLGFPSGNVSNATLNLNTCHSNSTGSWLGNLRIGDFRIPGTSATLVGTKETLMQSFRNNFKFHTIRGTSAGVSYNRKTLRPEPQFRFQSWVYLNSK